MMQKGIVLFTVLVFVLLASIFTGVHTVVARGPPSVDVEQTSSAALVNQHVKITVTLSGGNPPYTYQWYTQLWTTWEPGMSYKLPIRTAWVRCHCMSSSPNHPTCLLFQHLPLHLLLPLLHLRFHTYHLKTEPFYQVAYR